MLDSIRVRLTCWHLVIVLALQAVLCLCIYNYIRVHLNRQVNGILTNVLNSVEDVSQSSGIAGNDPASRAENALRRIKHTETPVAIYDEAGNLLAERPLGAAHITQLAGRPMSGTYFGTEPENLQEHFGARRVAIRRVPHLPGSSAYFVAASTSLYSRLDELHTARVAFLIGIPFMLLLTALGGWILTGRSLTPAVLMAERARTIGADNMSERLSVPHPRDELGRLALALNELLDRLAKASLSERQFMADAAHELRTPLSVAQTATTVALMNDDSTLDDYRSTLRVIDKYLQRLGRSVNHVFRLARADAGFKSLRIESIYLDEIVLDAVRAARVLAVPKNIVIHLDKTQASPGKGDEALLHEMLLNLLENAIKYTPDAGCVSVDLNKMNEVYEISIEDTGIGIEPADQERIFQRFYRGTYNAGAQKIEGTGLGLSIAQWIARSHLGSLELKTSSKYGSTFVIRLPAR